MDDERGAEATMAELVDVDNVSSSGFGLANQLPAGFDSDWHRHEKHQLLYAAVGTLHLNVDRSQWLFPPQRAAWIPAGVVHRVRAGRPVELCTAYLAPRITREICQIAEAAEACCVFVVPAVAREMILYGARWGPARDPDDAVANRFFEALAGLCSEWMQQTRPWRLPMAQTPALRKAMDYALAHLAEAPALEDAARVAGLSPRTLTRRFADEAQTTWRAFLLTARMLRAMELLAEKDTQVTATSYAVGFESISAFSSAFKLFAGETPREYRRRMGR